MSNLPTNIPTAIGAAITQIVALIVAFGILNNRLAGVVIAASFALLNVGVLVADAIIQHGRAKIEVAKIDAGLVPAPTPAPTPAPAPPAAL